MSPLDYGSLLLGHFLTLCLSAALLGLLWRQQRQHSSATGYWFANYALQCLALVLLAARGHVPEWLSIVLAGGCIAFGLIILHLGLARYIGQPGGRRRHWVVFASFIAAHSYFTFFTPDLGLRNSNVAMLFVLIAGQSAWLLWRRAPDDVRPESNLVAGVLALIVAFSALRIAYFLGAGEAATEMFAMGSVQSAILLGYQVSALALAISLVLMVNRRLSSAARHELDERRESERRLMRAELAAKVGNWELDRTHRVFSASPGALAIYGMRSDQLEFDAVRNVVLAEFRPTIDTAFANLLRGAPYDVEFRLRALDTGAIKDIHSIASYDSARDRILGTITDITELKNEQRKLEQLARFDALTGLPNRRLLADRLQQAVAQCERRQGLLAVAFLDLDGFKQINDTHTHEAGDVLLVQVTQRLKLALREGDTLARVGGDEFIAVLMDLVNVADGEQVLQRLLEAAAQPVEFNALTLQVSASIGVTYYPTDNSGPEILIRNADQAMYQAKHRGKNQIQSYLAT